MIGVMQQRLICCIMYSFHEACSRKVSPLCIIGFRGLRTSPDDYAHAARNAWKSWTIWCSDTGPYCPSENSVAEPGT